MRDLRNGSPANIDGVWGAKIVGGPEPIVGDRVLITTRKGKRWISEVTGLVETRSLGNTKAHFVLTKSTDEEPPATGGSDTGTSDSGKTMPNMGSTAESLTQAMVWLRNRGHEVSRKAQELNLEWDIKGGYYIHKHLANKEEEEL